MSETKRLLNDKRAITPLWIVALFVSLTETVLGVAVTQTSGGIQVSLTVFVLVFPLLIAGSFFGILWSKPYVFYPPTEFGPQVNVNDYVSAMQRRPALAQQIEGQPTIPLTAQEVRAVDEIVDTFLNRLAPVGLTYLYAFSLAHSKAKTLTFGEINSVLGEVAGDTYGEGILSATSAVGLLTYRGLDNKPGAVVQITDMNLKLKRELRAALDKRLVALELSGFFKPPLTQGIYKDWQDSRIEFIENYFNREPSA